MEEECLEDRGLLPWWSVAKNQLCNAGDVCLSRGQGTKISRAVEHLSPHALVLQSWHATRRECVGHNERPHVAVTKIPSPTTKPNK